MASSNVRLTKPPLIPVRMNRRTGIKPMSKIYGDDLPMLKRIKKSEQNPQVRGTNAAYEAKLKETLNRWYSSQEYQLNRIRKGQVSVQNGLYKLHLKKRQMQRDTLVRQQNEYREMARRNLERLRELEGIRDLEEYPEDQGASDDALPSPEVPATSKVRKSIVITETITELPEEETPDNAKETERQADQNPVAVSTDSNVKPEGTLPERDGLENKEKEKRKPQTIIQESKALEVKKDSPYLLVRSKNNLQDPDQQGEQSDDSQIPTSQAIISGDVMAKAYVSTSSPLQQVKQKDGAKFLRPPLEGTHRKPLKSPHVSTIHEDGDGSEMTQKAIVPPIPVQQSPRDHINNVQPSIPQTPRSLETTPLPPIEPKSIAQQNRERRRKQEQELRKILDEPYEVYTRNAAGKIVALGSSPIPFDMKEPSNKKKYKHDKVLKAERAAYLEKMKNLGSFTSSMVKQESDKRKFMESFAERIRIQAPKDTQASSKGIGPAEWMQVFLSSNLPEDVDPESEEALLYCRYLRGSVDLSAAQKSTDF